VGVILQQGAFSKPCVLIEASQPTPPVHLAEEELNFVFHFYHDPITMAPME